MTYDVSGHTPRSEAGEFFRVNFFSWSVIWSLIALANSNQDGRLIDPESLRKLSRNDGAVPGEQANALADAMEEILGDDEQTECWLAFSRVDNSPAVQMRQVLGMPSGSMPHETRKSKVELARSFCRFVRESGGFTVT